MPVMTSTLIAAAGLGLGAVGAYQQYKAGQGQEKVIAAEQQANAVRNQQMTLDAMRRKRDVIRQAQVAQAQATSVASAQGAGQSSGVAGANASISGQSGVNLQGINQNEQIGNQLFAINNQRAEGLMEANNASSLGAGLSSLGGAMMKNSGTIASVGQYAYSKFA